MEEDGGGGKIYPLKGERALTWKAARRPVEEEIISLLVSVSISIIGQGNR